MTPDDVRSKLAAECDVFTRYLTGGPPSRYVVSKYLAAVEHEAAPPDGLDARLLELAGRGPLRTRTADVWSRVFAPRSRLRRRLVLLLAILECTPAAEQLDRIAPTSPVRVVLELSWRAATSGVLLVVGTLLLTPALRLRDERAPGA